LTLQLPLRMPSSWSVAVVIAFSPFIFGIDDRPRAAQVLDGMVLVLAVILKPRAKKRRARLAAGMNGKVEIKHGCDGDGDDGNHGNGNVIEAVVPEVQQDEEKGPTMP
jgi:hypothetical protein